MVGVLVVWVETHRRGGFASSEHTLSAGPVAIGEARKHVRERLSDALSPGKIGEAELLTSELVSNAVRHGGLNGRDVLLTIGVNPRAIRVSVVDGGVGFDTMVPTVLHGSDEGGGWGLFLVEEMSDRWGIDLDPHGVWFELDRAMRRRPSSIGR
jgi:anti-sigma regulatory factor (Ser/Thr protein kinase)